MARRFALVVAVAVATLTLAGCKKPANEQDTLLQEAREAGDAVPATSAAPSTAARPNLQLAPVQDQDNEPPAANFAGTYTGNIPCDGCSGKASLTLSADGNYTITRSSGPNPGSNGHWSTEEQGARVRLDPVRKEDGSQAWRVTPQGNLEQLDTDGSPLARNARPEILTRAH